MTQRVATAIDETVTVLFTDLVGSTELSSRVGPAPADELRREHFGLIRAALDGGGGREVKNLGDGLMIVFPSVGAAVNAAISMQQRLDQRNRRAEHRLEVRIGIALGDATCEDGDYFGPPIVEAARLCARAASGQIVITEMVRMMVGGGRGYAFSCLGAVELKGLPEPVATHEVHWKPLGVENDAVPLPPRLRGVPEVSYVGREREREALANAYEEVKGAARQIVLLSGEPGIGKTRLATYAATTAYASGAGVLYGRCDEDLGIPYQPWIEAIGEYIESGPKAVIEAHVETHGSELRRLIPHLARRVRDLPDPHVTDRQTERHLLFAAMLGLLEEAARERPLVLVLDDLHWADKPSLALLRHVALSAADLPILVIGTFRSSVVDRSHDLNDLLADLRRENRVTRVAMTGLTVPEIASLLESVTGHELSDEGAALAVELQRETEGNPFFVAEVLRYLLDTGGVAQGPDGRWGLTAPLGELGVPDSVREVIGQRIDRLGADARRALSAAAVIGRDFDLDLLRRVTGDNEDDLLDLLEQAVGALVLVEDAARPGAFAFVHALIEHVLYEDLGRTRRGRLHVKAAEALEEVCATRPHERLGELAYHWGKTSATEKAVKAAARAGRHAFEQLAPDEAARWYDKALALHEGLPTCDEHERCELLIGLGEAQRHAGDPGFRQTLMDAARLAESRGESDQLARAALAVSRSFTGSIGKPDEEKVAVVEAAAAALPADHPLRARILSVLAMELAFSADFDRRRALADEGLTLARRSGDATALCQVLLAHTFATWSPDTVKERLRHTAELVSLAETTDDPILCFLAAGRRQAVLEVGDIAEMDASLERMRRLADAVPNPEIRWLLLFSQSRRALLAGNIEDAEALALQAFECASVSGQADALALFGAQIVAVRWEQGRLGELTELIAKAVEENPSLPIFRAWHALALCEQGRDDEARALLHECAAGGFADVPVNVTWTSTFAVWSEVVAHLGEQEVAATLYAHVSGVEHLLATAAVVFWGSMARYSGLLATTLGRYDDAERAFEVAEEVHEKIAAPIYVARTRLGLAEALTRRGGANDATRAQELLGQALEAARAHGCAALEARAEGLLGACSTQRIASQGWTSGR